MRRNLLPISDRKRRAAMIVSLALVTAACADRPDPVAPESDRTVAPAPQASIGQIQGGTAAIMAIVDGATAAWAAKDAAAYAAFYSTDVQVTNPVGAVLSGRAAFEAGHVFLFGGPFAGSTQTITVRAIDFLTGTIAIVYQDVTLTGYAFLPPGLPSQNGEVNTRVTWVVVKGAGTWEIVSQQMTPIL